MRLLRHTYLSALCLPLTLAGCSSGQNFVAKYEPWRAKEETACLKSGVLAHRVSLTPRSSLGGPSYCGAARPFKMSAADDGRVEISPPALLRCPMIPQVDRWVRGPVAKAAYDHFGQRVTKVKTSGSYACRPMNHKHGAKLSEHGYANALDISGFVLADGRTISVKRGWNGTMPERSFLRDVHRGACRNFTTVLGPNYNRAHHDHFHVDLARHGSLGLKTICK